MSFIPLLSFHFEEGNAMLFVLPASSSAWTFCASSCVTIPFFIIKSRIGSDAWAWAVWVASAASNPMPPIIHLLCRLGVAFAVRRNARVCLLTWLFIARRLGTHCDKLAALVLRFGDMLSLSPLPHPVEARRPRSRRIAQFLHPGNPRNQRQRRPIAVRQRVLVFQTVNPA